MTLNNDQWQEAIVQLANNIGAAAANANGQATMANSSPVVLPSDQFGSESDTAVTDSTQTNKSFFAFMKGLVKILADVWDSTNHRLYTGCATNTLFTTTQTTVGTSNSGDLDTSKLREISIDITTSAHAGTNPTIQFFLNRKGADGIYYPLWQTAVLSATANTISTSIGPGLAYNQSLGPTCQLSWTVGGSAGPTWTFTPNLYGK